jgi:6-phosphogluconolactonase
MKTLCLLAMVTAMAAVSLGKVKGGEVIYVASIVEKTVTTFAVNPDSGELTKISSLQLPESPGAMDLSPSGKHVYVAMAGRDAKTNKATAFVATLERQKDNTLTLSATAAIATRPPYIRADDSGQYLMMAHYASGEINVYRIKDGIVTSEHLDYHKTEKTAHCVEMDPSGRFVYVPHTAPNAIYQYVLDAATGKLIPNTPPIVSGPDEGHQYHQPRHIAFHPSLSMAFTSNERGGGISAYSLNRKTGALKLKQTLSALPEGYTGGAAAADIRITPNGKFVYVSNRDLEEREPHQDSIAAFSINRRGDLQRIGTYSAVWFPRSMTINQSGRFLYAAGQKSGTLISYAIDAKTGALQTLKTYDVGDGAIWAMSAE